MTDLNFKTLKIEKFGTTMVLTVNRPEALNALNGQVIQELEMAMTHLGKVPFSDMRCLVITGAGEKSFVAGADIKEMMDCTQDQAHNLSQRGHRVFSLIENFKTPVIAAVNGFALGGGCELALACDFIYSSENAKFGLPEVTLGLIPGYGGTVRLTKAIGTQKAREMILTGEMITAAQAAEIGLVNKVFPFAELMTGVLKTADTIGQRAPKALQAAKKSHMHSYDSDGLEKAYNYEAELFAKLFTTEDVREGTTAFTQKRKPDFKGQ